MRTAATTSSRAGFDHTQNNVGRHGLHEIAGVVQPARDDAVKGRADLSARPERTGSLTRRLCLRQCRLCISKVLFRLLDLAPRGHAAIDEILRAGQIRGRRLHAYLGARDLRDFTGLVRAQRGHVEADEQLPLSDAVALRFPDLRNSGSFGRHDREICPGAGCTTPAA